MASGLFLGSGRYKAQVIFFVGCFGEKGAAWSVFDERTYKDNVGKTAIEEEDKRSVYNDEWRVEGKNIDLDQGNWQYC